MHVLTVNAGSTSLKVASVVDGETRRWWGSLGEALAAARGADDGPDCVAHRVVHGGARVEAEVVDDDALAELQALTDLAPLHQPPALTALEQCRAALPAVTNVACFDTAFHATIPEVARTYALPARYRAEVRAYGFHGLSYAWATGRVARVAPEARRVLVAHLGGGQSLCAMLDGRSVATTMGFTPLDGLVMATRSGALDPGALLWLARHHPDDDLARVLEEESGLLGLAGTGDLRVVRARAVAGDSDAALALGVWRHRLVTLAGACVAALGGLDALVLTGGIGEHDHETWRDLADGLGWLGVETGDGRPTGDPDVRDVTGAGSRVRVLVVTAREELQLATEATACVARRRPGGRPG